MRQIFKIFRNLRPVLYILLSLALTSYFLISFYLINIPELFPGAYELGQFVLKISISYVSAFIFYFVVVHLKNEKDKSNVSDFVGITVHQIIDHGKDFVIPLLKIKDPNLAFEYPESRSELEDIMNVDPYLRQAPLHRGADQLNWLEYYDHLIRVTQTSIDNVLRRMNFLDSELVKLLTRLEQSLLFKQFGLMPTLMNLRPENCKLSLLTTQLESYLKLIKDLEVYANKHYMNKEMTEEFLGWK
ncbi:MAG: hypothetical protein AAFY41_11015 [Bacteroidota bacterium]